MRPPSEVASALVIEGCAEFVDTACAKETRIFAARRGSRPRRCMTDLACLERARLPARGSDPITAAVADFLNRPENLLLMAVRQSIRPHGAVTNLAERIARMLVRITRKLADRVDGIDLSHCTVGDVIELAECDGQMIIAEGWAEFARRATDGPDAEEPLALTIDGWPVRGDRRDSSRPHDLYLRLREKREQIEQERRRLCRRATDAGTTNAA
jgi:hypothetical protein